MLHRWVNGEELGSIADAMLHQIQNEDYRADVFTEFVAAVFEHHLPWVLRTLISWTNDGLSDQQKIPEDLPMYLHHGVPTASALELMANGIRSRRLATRVAAELGFDEPDVMRDRLRNMTVDQWREYFEAAPTELRDLLAYVHDPATQPASRLLEGEAIVLSFEPAAGIDVSEPIEVDLHRLPEGPEPRVWTVQHGSDPIGEVSAAGYVGRHARRSRSPAPSRRSRDAGPTLTITRSDS